MTRPDVEGIKARREARRDSVFGGDGWKTAECMAFSDIDALLAYVQELEAAITENCEECNAHLTGSCTQASGCLFYPYRKAE